MTLAEAGEWSLPLRQLVGLLLADWGGFHEWMVYVGVLPLMLAIAGCGKQEAEQQAAGFARFLLLASCLVIAALFALGTNGPLFPLLFRIRAGADALARAAARVVHRRVCRGVPVRVRRRSDDARGAASRTAG